MPRNAYRPPLVKNERESCPPAGVKYCPLPLADTAARPAIEESGGAPVGIQSMPFGEASTSRVTMPPDDWIDVYGSVIVAPAFQRSGSSGSGPVPKSCVFAVPVSIRRPHASVSEISCALGETLCGVIDWI